MDVGATKGDLTVADEPLTRAEGRDLRDAIRELTGEFKGFRGEMAQTFVRQDLHDRDLRLLTESHNRDIALLTQTLTALRESMAGRIDGAEDRIDKIDGDADWLKKVIYAAIVLAILGGLGVSSAVSTGLWK